MRLNWGYTCIKQSLGLPRGVIRHHRLCEIYPEWNHDSVDVNIFSIFVDVNASTRFFGNWPKNRFFTIFDQNLSKINEIWGVTVSRAWLSYVNPFIWWVCHIHSTFWWFSEKCQKSWFLKKCQKWPITPWEGLASISTKSM